MNTLGKGVSYSSCVWCVVGCVLEMHSLGLVEKWVPSLKMETEK